MEKDFIPTPVDMNAMPKMVGTRSSTPGDTSYADSFQMGTTTFFYTLDDGTKFSYHGESRDFERELKKRMPHYEMKEQLQCKTGAPPRKRFVGPRHDDDNSGLPAEAASPPHLVRRAKANTPAPGPFASKPIHAPESGAPPGTPVSSQYTNFLRFHDPSSSLSVSFSKITLIDHAPVHLPSWCNYSHHPKRTMLSTFSVPVADINAKCGGNQDDEGRGAVQGNAWNDYNHTMADARVYVGRCPCIFHSGQCGPFKNGLLRRGYTSDTT
ncbi:hypothetical protein PG999_000319 [Apiospora kogelbergensis]|uniref:Uncharacterized protein n=1 Tax=Apiospora kogelbergensis TaxID=1337665 RepID=A0AAW0RBA1_9PEZI